DPTRGAEPAHHRSSHLLARSRGGPRPPGRVRLHRRAPGDRPPPRRSHRALRLPAGRGRGIAPGGTRRAAPGGAGQDGLGGAEDRDRGRRARRHRAHPDELRPGDRALRRAGGRRRGM
ncbi:MAG: hypothetical protein AVDCRST_MAG38-1880, partial [uncultured Solirubrobacteraceae bacterium]